MKLLFWRISRTVLLTCAVLFLLFLALLFTFQRDLIFIKRPHTPELISQIESQAGVTPISFPTSDGTQTAYLLARTAQPTHLWLVFAGQGGLSLDWFPYFSRHIPNDQAVVFIDFPGLAKNQGSASLEGIKRSILAIPHALRDKLPPALMQSRENWRVFGNSLGSASALIAADELEIPHGILLCPFTNLGVMAERVTRLPIGSLILDRFDNVERVRHLTRLHQAHFTLFHGAKDSLIPISHAAQLHATAPNLIDFITVPEADHNDIPAHAHEKLLSTLLELCH